MFFPLSPYLQQACGVTAEDAGLVGVGDRQVADGVEHQRDAADLVRVVAAREDPVGAGELDRQLQRALGEVDRVVVEVPLQVRRGRLVDPRPALLERAKPAIEPLGRLLAEEDR